MQIKKFTRILPRKIYKICIFISVIVVFVSAFLALSSVSANAATQSYFTMLSPTSAFLWNQETISKISGFNQTAVVNNFSNPIGANYALTLYRYRTDDWYYWTEGEVQSFSVQYDLSRGVYMAPGTYRVRFYVECGTDNIYKPWWEDLNDKQIQNYIDSYFSPGTLPTSWNFTYIQLGTRYIPLIPSNRGTVVYSDGAERVLEFYDYTFTTDTSVSNILLNVAVRYNLSAAGSSSLRTRFTSGVSQASIDIIYDSSAEAEKYPDNKVTGSDDLDKAEDKLHDFSKDSGASDFLDSSHLSSFVGPEYLAGMDGISEYMQYLYSEWPWIQTIVYVSVSLGIVALLFNLGAAFLSRRK